jgi:ElaB/YqjD/DUF883 family membrane-anchored ribosome-binding protein
MSTRFFEPTTEIFNHTHKLKKAAFKVANDLHDEATNQLSGLKDMASSQLSEVRGRASDSWQAARGFVKQHPLMAISIGLAAGLVVAALATTRRD